MSAMIRDLKAFFPFIGIGGAPRGFQNAKPYIKQMTTELRGQWRVLGGIDNDAGAVANAATILLARIANMDLFSAEQYEAFHGRRPPEGWREVTPADVRAAAGGEYPDLILTSPPCKGYSGLLAESLSKTAKYEALNELALRGVWLCFEAFGDDPPAFFLLENVPRMLTRGRQFLDRIDQLFRHYGYATADTVHDCGELGGLAQSRKRLLKVGRHMEKVPNFLYQPPAKPLRAVGDVLGKLPVPGPDADDMPLHRLPRLQWKTWVRLAFVEAGSDWRSLNRLRVEDGVLADYGLVPARDWYRGAYGVTEWGEPAGTMTGNARPAAGAFSIADPRFDSKGNDYKQYGVGRWTEETGAVINVKSPGHGGFCVADPRCARVLFNHAYRVARFDCEAPAIAGPGGAGGMAVADPRPPAGPLFSKYAVSRWAGRTGTVIGGDDQGAYAVADPRPAWENRRNNLHVGGWEVHAHTLIAGGKGVQGGWLSVADPRPNMDRSKGYVTGGHYGVVPWDGTAYAVTGSGQHDNGHNNVADVRLPAPNDKLQCLIIAEDGTWHRPFTTLECAALQSLFDIDEYRDFALTGGSDGQIREWIGNAIPSDAAEAMAEVFGHALLLAGSGETFILSNAPIWVQPIVAALQFGSEA